MSNHGCVNGSLDGVDYAGPVPFIGLYIAGASLACMAVMLYDIIVAGIIARKRWLPCLYFKLDSVSLTLLGVATKLPVDLTTSMPGPYDQLSKLTGTAIICAAMAFLAPSLGVNGESECFTNMLALSIFVVTVAVNISIQLYTGVIVLFFVENIIMLCLMLTLLLMLWHICFCIKVEKRIDGDRYRNLLSKGSNSLFERLKLSYSYAYCSNPQYRISTYPMNAAVSTICLGCAGIIVETTFRSVILHQVEFCQGVSDYSWSMTYIVIAQVVTVIVGTIAVVARWVALFSRMEFESIILSFLPDYEDVIQKKKTLKAKGLTWSRFLNFFGYIITKLVLIAQVVALSPSLLVYYLMRASKKNNNGVTENHSSGVTGNDDNGVSQNDDNSLEFFGEGHLICASRYIVRKSLDDMIRLMNQVANFKSPWLQSTWLCLKTWVAKFMSPLVPSTCLCLETQVANSESPDLLTSNYLCLMHSQYADLNSQKIRDGVYKIEVSSLTIALLVKIAQACIPKNRLKNILNAFAEAKEVILFIDQTIQPKGEVTNKKLGYAKDVWRGGDLTCLLQGYTQPGMDHEAAVVTMKKLKETLHSGDIWSDLGDVVTFINRKRYSSMDELCKAIEQLFADMLHTLYAQLPTAIHKSLSDTPPEEFEESVRLAMEFLFKIGELDCQYEWVFPPGMTCVVKDPTPVSVYTGALERLEEVVLVHITEDTGNP